MWFTDLASSVLFCHSTTVGASLRKTATEKMRDRIPIQSSQVQSRGGGLVHGFMGSWGEKEGSGGKAVTSGASRSD